MAKAKVPENLTLTWVGDEQRYRPSWFEVRNLGWRVGIAAMDSSFEIIQVVPVSRGGMVPGDAASRATGIKNVQTLAIEQYKAEPDDKGNPVPDGEMKVYAIPKVKRRGKGALFIDDVLDKGNTAAFIKDSYP